MYCARYYNKKENNEIRIKTHSYQVTCIDRIWCCIEGIDDPYGLKRTRHIEDASTIDN